MCYCSRLTHPLIASAYLLSVNPVETLLDVAEGWVGFHETNLSHHLCALGQRASFLQVGPLQQRLDHGAVQRGPQGGHARLQLRYPARAKEAQFQAWKYSVLQGL